MSTLTLPEPALSAELPSSDSLYEFLDGKYVELPPMSTQASIVASRLVRELGIFAKVERLGEVASETLFGLTPRSRRMRRPDIAFVSYKRWPKNQPLPTTDPWPVVPEMIVEVVSPSDLAEGTHAKVKEYFVAGVQLVWLVYPQLAWVVAYESAQRMRGFTLADELDAEPILPGFRLPLQEIFDQPPTPPGNGEPDAEPEAGA